MTKSDTGCNGTMTIRPFKHADVNSDVLFSYSHIVEDGEPVPMMHIIIDNLTDTVRWINDRYYGPDDDLLLARPAE